MKLIVLLIDERPEEVTDIKESIEGEQVEVIYSTFVNCRKITNVYRKW